MSHRSRGCLRCRQRRVKCDRARPSCQRCIARNELCVGYRDEADLMFQDETSKTALKSLSESSVSSSSPRSRRTRSRSAERVPPSSTLNASFLQHPSAFPWLKTPLSRNTPILEDQAVSAFMDRYVIYPCNSSSSPGFLEHLPGLFKDVNVEGRHALRWAVQAASYADLSRDQSSEELIARALECYGRALDALGKSLAEKGKTPDDYDLMTVVVLDIFETLFVPDTSIGSHSQGMAHILRLRGHDQFHDPRGWGLFRLAHHRLQKQQLAKSLDPLPESSEWLETLNDELSFVRLEKDSLEITTICQRAQQVLSSLNADNLTYTQLIELIDEMLCLDKKAAQWRQRPEWSYKKLNKRDIDGDPDVISHFPETVELHPDVWMAYEWNYHRTGRIILHQKLLACIHKGLLIPPSQRSTDSKSKLLTWEKSSLSTIHSLANGVLSSVPQSFGDIDHIGRCLSTRSNPPRCQGIGAYLLLWPMNIMKDPKGFSTPSQQEAAQAVFERIRESTGMKSNLGALSIV